MKGYLPILWFTKYRIENYVYAILLLMDATGLLDRPIRSFACSCGPICSPPPSSKTNYIFNMAAKAQGLWKQKSWQCWFLSSDLHQPRSLSCDIGPQACCLTPSPVLLSSSCCDRDGCCQTLTPNPVCISAVVPKLTSSSLEGLSPGANQSCSFVLLTERNVVKVLAGFCSWPWPKILVPASWGENSADSLWAKTWTMLTLHNPNIRNKEERRSPLSVGDD